jgi:undecaprenyl-diphosphatase
VSPGHGRPLSCRQAAALGIVQGATELLPVSSSAHLSVIPRLLGWEYGELDDGARKAFEVALHGAGLAGALIVLGEELLGGDVTALAAVRASMPGRRRLRIIGLASLAPGVAGLVLERRIEGCFGTPGWTAAGLVAGSLAMVLADRAAQEREAGDAEPADALWLGVAQTAALIPGISRSGATLAVARRRRFARLAAASLSRDVGLPVVLAATGLKAARLSQRPGGVGGGALAAGGAGALLSSLALARHASGLAARPLTGFALYRCALAAVTLACRGGA